jgi:hypothetical protein
VERFTLVLEHLAITDGHIRKGRQEMSEQVSYIIGIIIFSLVFLISGYTLIRHKYKLPKYKDHQLWLSALYITVSVMFILLYARLLLGIVVSRGELRVYIFFCGFTLLISAIEVAVRRGVIDGFLSRVFK